MLDVFEFGLPYGVALMCYFLKAFQLGTLGSLGCPDRVLLSDWIDTRPELLAKL
tara:strand:+ start:938 stop:1099 length:162 start_codon:yes stop_codon:yes gene_type:complete